MIAPSPDWFIGIRDVNLYAGNTWVNKLEFDLKLYDSGTDTGVRFDSNNANGGTGIIALVTSLATDTDINEGVHRTNGKVVGTIIIQRITDSFLGTSEEQKTSD
jgi:metal-dependent HD superfamily phosphatase/phosphodiesterase